MDKERARTEEQRPLIEEYHCPICGASLRTCKHWGPTCRKHGRRVCAECCRKCENHVSWSGIWRCSHLTPEKRKQLAMQRIRSRSDTAIAEASAAYMKRMREQARRRAARSARARAGRNR